MGWWVKSSSDFFAVSPGEIIPSDFVLREGKKEFPNKAKKGKEEIKINQGKTLAE